MDIINTKAATQAYRDNWDAIFGKPKEAPKMKNQYFYRENSCPANESGDPDCICWHDEGTGPYPTSNPEEGTVLTWRSVPV